MRARRWIAAASGLAAMLALPGVLLAEPGLDIEIGKRLFKRAWVPAPSSTTADDGLGPLFNARSCLACHGDLARATPRGADPFGRGMVVRLGDAEGRPDPVYGVQIQTQATTAVEPEAQAGIAGHPVLVDGRSLQRLEVRLDLTGPELAPATRVSLRAAPAIDIAGRIEMVDSGAIEAAARASGGRVARLADGRIGRFGWKAAAPDLAAFTANAFANDLGMSTPAHPAAGGDCTPAQVACLAAPGGRPAPDSKPEIAPEIVAAIAAYLAVQTGPASARAPASGSAVFARIGCGQCHVPQLATTTGGHVTLYSDLALHDMGAGLDDGVGEGAARPGEWRTAPLAGVGRAEAAGLLHDGRARSIDEAVLWHGGSAAAARAGYLAATPGERARLVAFLKGL